MPHAVTPPPERANPELLVASPYLGRSHLLDLDTVPPAQRHLVKALTIFKPVDKHYATRPYPEAFNFSQVVEELRSRVSEDDTRPWQAQSFYIVAFRSRLPDTTDRDRLGRLDAAAHEEATSAGGLWKYWFGVPDADGRNLATCVWRSREDAVVGGQGPAHRQAAMQTRSLYLEWKVETWELWIGDDVKDWQVRPWSK